MRAILHGVCSLWTALVSHGGRKGCLLERAVLLYRRLRRPHVYRRRHLEESRLPRWRHFALEDGAQYAVVELVEPSHMHEHVCHVFPVFLWHSLGIFYVDSKLILLSECHLLLY